MGEWFTCLCPNGQCDFTVHRACLEDGNMYWLSSCLDSILPQLSSTSAASRGKGALGRTMQQWRVVGIRLRGRKTSMMGLQ